jgi:hypothetical protein
LPTGTAPTPSLRRIFPSRAGDADTAEAPGGGLIPLAVRCGAWNPVPPGPASALRRIVVFGIQHGQGGATLACRVAHCLPADSTERARGGRGVVKLLTIPPPSAAASSAAACAPVWSGVGGGADGTGGAGASAALATGACQRARGVTGSQPPSLAASRRSTRKTNGSDSVSWFRRARRGRG